MPELQEHYGQQVWTDPEGDALRRTNCLCRHCLWLSPGQPDNCRYAQQLYEVCKQAGAAVFVTRCRWWEKTNTPFLPAPGEANVTADEASSHGDEG